jgi:hypothetical protein
MVTLQKRSLLERIFFAFVVMMESVFLFVEGLPVAHELVHFNIIFILTG